MSRRRIRKVPGLKHPGRSQRKLGEDAVAAGREALASEASSGLRCRARRHQSAARSRPEVSKTDPDAAPILVLAVKGPVGLSTRELTRFFELATEVREALHTGGGHDFPLAATGLSEGAA